MIVCTYIYNTLLHTHTHTHIHIYIYIYIVVQCYENILKNLLTLFNWSPQNIWLSSKLSKISSEKLKKHS